MQGSSCCTVLPQALWTTSFWLWTTTPAPESLPSPCTGGDILAHKMFLGSEETALLAGQGGICGCRTALLEALPRAVWLSRRCVLQGCAGGLRRLCLGASKVATEGVPFGSSPPAGKRERDLCTEPCARRLRRSQLDNRGRTVALSVPLFSC